MVVVYPGRDVNLAAQGGKRVIRLPAPPQRFSHEDPRTSQKVEPAQQLQQRRDDERVVGVIAQHASQHHVVARVVPLIDGLGGRQVRHHGAYQTSSASPRSSVIRAGPKTRRANDARGTL